MNRLFTLFAVLLFTACATAQAPLVSADGKTTTIYAADYGVVTNDPTVNNQAALQAAFNAARDAARFVPADEQLFVVLPPDTTYYRGILRVDPNGVQVVGCGGAVTTRATTDAGVVYYPQRRADRVDPNRCVSVLRVMDDSFVPDAKGRVYPTRLMLWPQGNHKAPVRRHHEIAFRNFILDGNLDGNLAGLQAITDKKSFIQDGIGHTGIAANGHDGVDMCEDPKRVVDVGGGRKITQTGGKVGTLISLDHMVISGYAATGAVGNRCTRWDLNVVRGEDSPYNHVFYHTDGGVSYKDQEQMSNGGPYNAWGGSRFVTLAGAAWTYWISQAGLHIQNLTFEEPKANAMRSNQELIDVRWGQVTVDGFVAGDPIPRSFWKSNGGTIVRNPDAYIVPPASEIVLPPSAAPDVPPVAPAPDPEPDPEPAPPTQPEPAPEAPAPTPDPEPAPDPFDTLCVALARAEAARDAAQAEAVALTRDLADVRATLADTQSRLSTADRAVTAAKARADETQARADAAEVYAAEAEALIESIRALLD